MSVQIQLTRGWCGRPAGAIVDMPTPEQADLMIRAGVGRRVGSNKTTDAPAVAKVILSPRRKK